MRSASTVLRMNTPAIEPALAPGNPSTKASMQFKNAGDLMCGTWECEPGSWEHDNKVDEHVMLLEGEMALKAGDTEEVFKAGDSFVISAGLKGVWEVRVAMNKYFVKHAPT